MEFDNVIIQTDDKLKRTLQFIPDDVKQKCEEIRIRKSLPVCLTIEGKVAYVCEDSTVSYTLPQNPLVATNEMVNETLARLCNNSIYLHEDEIKQGFISLKNGCRAGVCGVFNVDEMLVSVLSINIRIARQIIGCAKNLIPYTNDGLLIAGPPGCGKTTMLRDIIRLLSNGENGIYNRVVVIDSRREISGSGMMDLGVNTDVIYTDDKSRGTQIALRTMYPQFIAFDEIGTTNELDSVIDCFNAGVKVITTAHCNNENDILKRSVIKKIVEIGAIKNMALLSQQNHGNFKIFCRFGDSKKCL